MSYGVEDKPRLVVAFPLAFQHVLSAFTGQIAVGMLLAMGFGLNVRETALLIQCALFITGIATIIQSFGIGKHIGARFPIVSGGSFTLIAPMVVAANNPDVGIGGAFGAALAGSAVLFLLGPIAIRFLHKYFSPTVTGAVVLTVGVCIGATAFGNFNPESETALLELGIAVLVILVIVLLNFFGKGLAKHVEITSRLKTLLEKRGITIMTGSKVEKIEKKGGGLSVQVDAGGKKLAIPCEEVLVSMGREMDVEGLNLDGAGIRYDRKGIKVDENYETNVKGIYAIGDVTGRVMLAHVASDEGKMAAERMAGEKSAVDYDLIPNSIFTFPDVSSIGLSEEQAREQGLDYVISKYQFSGNGKAMTMNDAEGMVKVIASKDKSRILGVHIIGPNASDLIAEAAMAMNGMFTVEEAADVMHGHPTLSEAFDEAVSNLLGKAIHMPPVKK